MRYSGYGVHDEVTRCDMSEEPSHEAPQAKTLALKEIDLEDQAVGGTTGEL